VDLTIRASEERREAQLGKVTAGSRAGEGHRVCCAGNHGHL
jgi:hypothetical protein